MKREMAAGTPTATTAVGIDAGIIRFATLSVGTPVEPVNCFKRHQQQLARHQRQMARKVKFSKDWRKAKTRVQRLHARIANMRKDFLTCPVCHDVSPVNRRTQEEVRSGHSVKQEPAEAPAQFSCGAVGIPAF